MAHSGDAFKSRLVIDPRRDTETGLRIRWSGTASDTDAEVAPAVTGAARARPASPHRPRSLRGGFQRSTER
jgi:hypothetical protein